MSTQRLQYAVLFPCDVLRLVHPTSTKTADRYVVPDVNERTNTHLAIINALAKLLDMRASCFFLSMHDIGCAREPLRAFVVHYCTVS